MFGDILKNKNVQKGLNALSQDAGAAAEGNDNLPALMQGGPSPVPSPLGSALAPGYEKGTTYVPETGKTDVHEGEAIIPKELNPWNPENSARKLYDQGRALLQPIDKEGFEQKNRMIDEYRGTVPQNPPHPIVPVQTAPVVVAPVKPIVNPATQYGTRPEEHRLDPLLRPLGPQLPIPKELQSAYDDGTKRVPEDGEAVLHEGEARIPAEMNPWNTSDGNGSTLGTVGVPDQLEAKNQVPSFTQKIDTGAHVSKHPLGKPIQVQPEDTSLRHVVAPDPNAIALDQKKQQAVQKGDLLGLGLAKLEENSSILPKYTGVLPSGESRPEAGAPLPAGTQAASDASKISTPEGWAQQRQILKDKLAQSTLRGDLEGARTAQDQLRLLDEQRPRGTFGKILHGFARAGEALGSMYVPELMQFIPGTELNKRMEEGKEERQQERQVKGEEIKKTEAEIRAMGIPKLMPDSESAYDRATGQVYEKWQLPYGGGTVYAPEGSSATEAMAIKQGKVPGVSQDAQLVRGKPTPEIMPASQAEVGNAHTEIGSLPSLTAEDKEGLLGALPEHPTVNDIKMAKETAKTVSAAREKHDDFLANKALRDLAAGIAADREKDRVQKLASDSVKKADNAYTTLAASQEYKKSAHDWFDSKNYGEKDKAIIGAILNDVNAKSTSILGGLANDTAIGAAIGRGPGAIAGAVAGALDATLGPAIRSELESQYRKQLSPEAYKAMQAYSTVLPGMIGYEVSVKGTPATVMRSAKTLNAIMNTLPSPLTPKDRFDSAFNLYYKPMEKITEDMVKELPHMPEDYKKPDITMYEDEKHAPEKGATTGGGNTNMVWDAVKGQYVPAPKKP